MMMIVASLMWTGTAEKRERSKMTKKLTNWLKTTHLGQNNLAQNLMVVVVVGQKIDVALSNYFYVFFVL